MPAGLGSVRNFLPCGPRSPGRDQFCISPAATWNARVHLSMLCLTPLTLVMQPPELAKFTTERHGHAIEVRINAEDPLHDYAPSSGILGHVQWPAPEEGQLPRPGPCLSSFLMSAFGARVLSCLLSVIAPLETMTQPKSTCLNLLKGLLPEDAACETDCLLFADTLFE